MAARRSTKGGAGNTVGTAWEALFGRGADKVGVDRKLQLITAELGKLGLRSRGATLAFNAFKMSASSLQGALLGLAVGAVILGLYKLRDMWKENAKAIREMRKELEDFQIQAGKTNQAHMTTKGEEIILQTHSGYASVMEKAAREGYYGTQGLQRLAETYSLYVAHGDDAIQERTDMVNNIQQDFGEEFARNFVQLYEAVNGNFVDLNTLYERATGQIRKAYEKEHWHLLYGARPQYEDAEMSQRRYSAQTVATEYYRQQKEAESTLQKVYDALKTTGNALYLQQVEDTKQAIENQKKTAQNLERERERLAREEKRNLQKQQKFLQKQHDAIQRELEQASSKLEKSVEQREAHAFDVQNQRMSQWGVSSPADTMFEMRSALAQYTFQTQDIERKQLEYTSEINENSRKVAAHTEQLVRAANDLEVFDVSSSEEE